MSDQGIVLPETSTPPPAPNTVFRGPNGIRAGWRVLIFLAIMAGFFVLFGFVVRILRIGQLQAGISSITPSGLSVLEGSIFVLTAIPALIMARIEHRKFGGYGLPARFAFRQDFWIGTLVGFLAISTSLFGIFVLHGFRLAGLAIHGKTIITSIAAWSAALWW